MAYEFHYKRRIHFQETDAAGLIHFTNYFRYMEEAETEFLLSLFGAKGLEPDDSLFVTPRVAVSAEFFKPTHFGDVLDCHLWVSRKGSTSLSYVVSFNRDGEEMARGKLTFVFVSQDEGGEYHASAIPAAVDQAIQTAPFAHDRKL